MKSDSYGSLYQINTRVWLTELSQRLGRRATLDDIPDDELERLKEHNFDWVWLLSVWQTGKKSRLVSRSNPAWRAEFEETLPDLCEEDIGGSGFAITGYSVHRALGGNAALVRLRERLRSRGLRLMLDFIPNHTALDHPWVNKHPEYYVAGTELDLARAPENYARAEAASDGVVLAHGRDPYFPGWPDTFQLNYGNSSLQQAMIDQLLKISELCDGVRCDMAMLVLPEVFERTWGIASEEFWPKAFARVRERYPEFRFMAEVYWDLEWALQQQGFDYTYDKRLYDRLRDGRAGPVREHLQSGLDYQDRMARFLENHDEQRAAVTFSRSVHKAAAVITFLSPGLRFFHQGQLEGRKKRISPHLCRAPYEPVDEEMRQIYDRLLGLLAQPVFRDGKWQLLECRPAWEGNWTWDCFVVFSWERNDGERLVVAVNYAPNQSQCYARLPFADLSGGRWRLQDVLGEAVYDREGNDLNVSGLYLDEPPWKACVFSFTRLP